MSNSSPNQIALESMFKVEPALSRIGFAGELLELPKYTVLHAGPPFLSPLDLPQTIKSSLILSCIYEGWAKSEEEAVEMINSGVLNLKPAQDHHCVTPLAALITNKTAILGVTDQNSSLPCTYSPLSSGPPPDIRFGTRDLSILQTMHNRDHGMYRAVKALLTESIMIRPIALIGLSGGDELHSNTSAATQALRNEFMRRIKQSDLKAKDTEDLVDLMGKNPGFFLTIWMACCKLYLSSMEGVKGSTLVTRMGANAQKIGISLADQPEQWITCEANSPVGSRFEKAPKDVEVEGVVGDSCVIDIMGFGGQITQHAPEVFNTLKPFLPANISQRTSSIMTAIHPLYEEISAVDGTFSIEVGLDCEKMKLNHLSPLINIGMLSSDGKAGLLGRGVYLGHHPFF